jgi:hypothetical protein
VGCYEALIVVCAALAITLSPSVAVSVFATTWVVKETPLLDYLNVSSMVDGLVDGLVSGLLANVESILQKGALVRSRYAVLARLKVVSDKKISLLFLLRNRMQIFGSEVFEIFGRSFAVICLGSDQLNVLACGMKFFQSPLLFSAIGFRVQCYGLTNHGRQGPKCD